jgi:glycosidase
LNDLRKSAAVTADPQGGGTVNGNYGTWPLIHGMGFGALYLLAFSSALAELYFFTAALQPS